MSTISFRIDEDLKQQFHEITESLGIDTSTALRFFINKVIENPEIIKFDLDMDLLLESGDRKKCNKKKKSKKKKK